MRCLLVRTPDKKEFLTTIKNYPLLIEYANTFGGKLYTVETQGAVALLEINDLAKAICGEEGVKAKYEVIKRHIPADVRSNKRHDEQKLAGSIRKFIKAEILKGKPLSLIAIRQHFSKYGLKTCTISNHYASIRQQLTNQGMKIERVGHGVYQRKDK